MSLHAVPLHTVPCYVMLCCYMPCHYRSYPCHTLSLHAMLGHNRSSYAIPCLPIPCHTILCQAMPLHTTPCHAICTTPCHTPPRPAVLPAALGGGRTCPWGGRWGWTPVPLPRPRQVLTVAGVCRVAGRGERLGDAEETRPAAAVHRGLWPNHQGAGREGSAAALRWPP